MSPITMTTIAGRKNTNAALPVLNL